MKVRRCAECGNDLRDYDDRIECPQCGLPIAASRKAREQAWGRFGWVLAVVIGAVVVTVPLLLYQARARWWPEAEAVSRDRVRADADALMREVRTWMVDYGRTRLPAEFTLRELLLDVGRYVKPEDLLDPWGNEFVIDVDAMRVISYGADGLPGGIGDAKDVRSAPLP